MLSFFLINYLVLTSIRVSSSVQQLARMLRARSKVFLEHSGCPSRSNRGRRPPRVLNLAIPALSPLMCCVLIATRALHWDTLDLLSISLPPPESTLPCSAPALGLQRWLKHQVKEDSGDDGCPSLVCARDCFQSFCTGEAAMVYLPCTHYQLTNFNIPPFNKQKHYTHCSASLEVSSEILTNQTCPFPLFKSLK